MKYIYSLSLLFLGAGCHHSVSLQREKELQSLLDNKEYFKLRSALAKSEEEIGKDKSRWFHAFADNAFNRNAASTDNIRALLNDTTPGRSAGSSLPDSLKAKLL